jgi:RNA polymerase sigma factor (sigma-70 family)
MTVPLELEEGNLEVPIERETPEAMLIERSNRQLIQSAIEELPLHSREILLLCDLEEMSYRDISETLSIPIGTVMSRLSRARNTLAEVVRRKLEEGTVHGLRDLEHATRHLS